uniref:CatB-related O-acetyltransferase n=1 Tax=candidate division CPR3 bacterium TaxID=2268181 RepID=A0A7V3J944_UNCC3
MIKQFIPRNLKQVFNRFFLRIKFDVKIGRGSDVNAGNFFEGKNVIGSFCRIYNSTLGFGSYLADNCIIENTKIGRFCSIGQSVRTFIGRHPSKVFVSTHPAFYSTQKQAGFTFVEKDCFEEHLYVDPEKRFVVEIGNDVWIGNNVIIIDGIRIGNGAIVAAGAVVTKDVEPYAIVAGVPARVIRYRFPPDIIKFLLDFKWWDKGYDWIIKNSIFFRDIDKFYAKFIENYSRHAIL